MSLGLERMNEKGSWFKRHWLGLLSLVVAVCAIIFQARYMGTHWFHKHTALCTWVECNPIILKDRAQIWSVIGAAVGAIYIFRGWRRKTIDGQFPSVVIVGNIMALFTTWMVYT